MAIPQPNNFKELANQYLGNKGSKLERYWAAVFIRDSLVYNLEDVWEELKFEYLEKRPTLIGDIQFIEWRISTLKNWKIVEPDGFSGEETIKAIGTFYNNNELIEIIQQKFTKLINEAIHNLIAKDVKKHVNDYGNYPNEWDRIQELLKTRTVLWP